MSTPVMTAPSPMASPRLTARIAGVFYSLTVVTGVIALLGQGSLAVAAGVVAAGCYLAVTVLFYYIFRPVNRSLSLVAALVSLAGVIRPWRTIVLLPMRFLHLGPADIHPLVFFGLYCLLIGYLILSSTFIPRILAAPMACAGLGWLTFLSPRLVNYLSPYNFAPGILGEGVLTVWLLLFGVNEERWKEQVITASKPLARS